MKKFNQTRAAKDGQKGTTKGKPGLAASTRVIGQNGGSNKLGQSSSASADEGDGENQAISTSTAKGNLGSSF